MNRLRSKKETKYYDQLAKNIFARKTKFFRRNVHLNHKETYLKIIRIKNDEQFYDEIMGFKQLPREVCFLVHHINPLNDKDKYYKVRNSDFIITNSRTNRVLAMNQRIKNYSDFFNVWIVRSKTTKFLNIKINDIVFTR